MNKVDYLYKKFELFKEDGDWAIYFNRPVYKEIRAYGNYTLINTKTGKDCGQFVALRCTLFDEEGNKLDNPIYEDDTCYKAVEKPNV